MSNITTQPIIFSGNSNPHLSEKICQHMNLELSPILVSQFADQETRVELNCNVRGRDVFIIQSTCTPANHFLMEALIIIDACKRASANTITLVAPYFGYARQERKSAPRTPISAKLVAEMIEAAGASRVLTLELHTAALQGFFRIPVDHLFSKTIFSEYFKQSRSLENTIMVSPDAGGVERARAHAKILGLGLAIIDKRRDKPNESTVHHIIGDVKGKTCIIVDDIVDTGGSLTKAAEALFENGAASVSAAIAHPVLSGQACEKIESSVLRELITTDSIPLPKGTVTTKIHQVSIAKLMAEAISRIHRNDSISSLFY